MGAGIFPGGQPYFSVGDFGTAQLRACPDGTFEVLSCCDSEDVTRAELAELRDWLTAQLEATDRAGSAGQTTGPRR